MPDNSKDPADVVQQFIEKNKDALSEISFGGGTMTSYCNQMFGSSFLSFFLIASGIASPL